MSVARHGHLRGLDAPLAPGAPGRYGRLFPELRPAEHRTTDLTQLAEAMTAEPIEKDEPLGNDDDEENDAIPAGYTYLGQFIDHDLTFDPASSFERESDPAARVNFRTPRFDLDGLYGRGPADQPYLYADDSVHFLLGRPLAEARRNGARGFDLPRNARGRALLGDPRNDENRIVSQLHALLLRFHNRLVDELSKEKEEEVEGEVLFREAQRETRWHYQWIVVNDFLPRIVGAKRLARLIRRSSRAWRARLRWFRPRQDPFMPVEFSAACYRLGHSMVRPTYHVNETVMRETEARAAARGHGPHRTPIFSAARSARANLVGFQRVPPDFAFDWGFFFPIESPAQRRTSHRPQPSYRIDTFVSAPLTRLDETRGLAPGDPVVSLAERNLRRGRQLGLPSGQSIARRLAIAPLTTDQLFEGTADGRPHHLEGVKGKLRRRLGGETPLWYYILREAEVLCDGRQLGPVGGTIVAEVMVGLLFKDRTSFVHARPPWCPRFGRAKRANGWRFEMADLVQAATESA